MTCEYVKQILHPSDGKSVCFLSWPHMSSTIWRWLSRTRFGKEAEQLLRGPEVVGPRHRTRKGRERFCSLHWERVRVDNWWISCSYICRSCLWRGIFWIMFLPPPQVKMRYVAAVLTTTVSHYEHCCVFRLKCAELSAGIWMTVTA